MLKKLLYLYNDGHNPFPQLGKGGLGYHLPQYKKRIHGEAIHEVINDDGEKQYIDDGDTNINYLYSESGFIDDDNAYSHIIDNTYTNPTTRESNIVISNPGFEKNYFPDSEINEHDIEYYDGLDDEEWFEQTYEYQEPANIIIEKMNEKVKNLKEVTDKMDLHDKYLEYETAINSMNKVKKGLEVDIENRKELIEKIGNKLKLICRQKLNSDLSTLSEPEFDEMSTNLSKIILKECILFKKKIDQLFKIKDENEQTKQLREYEKNVLISLRHNSIYDLLRMINVLDIMKGDEKITGMLYYNYKSMLISAIDPVYYNEMTQKDINEDILEDINKKIDESEEILNETKKELEKKKKQELKKGKKETEKEKESMKQQTKQERDIKTVEEFNVLKKKLEQEAKDAELLKMFGETPEQQKGKNRGKNRAEREAEKEAKLEKEKQTQKTNEEADIRMRLEHIETLSVNGKDLEEYLSDRDKKNGQIILQNLTQDYSPVKDNHYNNLIPDKKITFNNGTEGTLKEACTVDLYNDNNVFEIKNYKQYSMSSDRIPVQESKITGTGYFHPLYLEDGKLWNIELTYTDNKGKKKTKYILPDNPNGRDLHLIYRLQDGIYEFKPMIGDYVKLVRNGKTTPEGKEIWVYDTTKFKRCKDFHDPPNDSFDIKPYLRKIKI
jgi:hypothetical protein